MTKSKYGVCPICGEPPRSLRGYVLCVIPLDGNEVCFGEARPREHEALRTSGTENFRQDHSCLWWAAHVEY